VLCAHVARALYRVVFISFQARLYRAEIKTVAVYLELKSSYDEFEKSMQEIIDVYPKNGPFLKKLCQTVYKVYSESNNIIVLYSTTDECYQVFI
jgi:hypothetical protein